MFASSGARANSEMEDVEWHGFLNVVGGTLRNSPVEDFTSAKQVPGFRGYGKDLTFDSQTSGALQASKQLDDKTAVTMQMYASGDQDNYAVAVKWLYLTYSPTANSSFRVGRIGAPVYYFSEFLNVGSAYHWISPPGTVYPFDSAVVGVDYVYQDVWRDLDWSLELTTGSSDDYVQSIDTRLISKNNLGVSLAVADGSGWSARAMAFRNDSKFVAEALSEDSIDEAVETAVDIGLAEAEIGSDLADLIRPELVAKTKERLDDGSLSLDDLQSVFLNFAVRYEREQWFLMLEAISVKNDTYLYERYHAGYLTAGIHAGSSLFHLTFQEGVQDTSSELEHDREYVPPEARNLDDYADRAANAIKVKLGGAIANHFRSASLGVRHDVSENVAIKIDITRFEEISSFSEDAYGTGSNLLVRSALNANF